MLSVLAKAADPASGGSRLLDTSRTRASISSRRLTRLHARWCTGPASPMPSRCRRHRQGRHDLLRRGALDPKATRTRPSTSPRSTGCPRSSCARTTDSPSRLPFARSTPTNSPHSEPPATVSRRDGGRRDPVTCYVAVYKRRLHEPGPVADRRSSNASSTAWAPTHRRTTSADTEHRRRSTASPRTTALSSSRSGCSKKASSPPKRSASTRCGSRTRSPKPPRKVSSHLTRRQATL